MNEGGQGILVNTGSSHQDAGEEKQNTRESGNGKGKKGGKKEKENHQNMSPWPASLYSFKSRTS